MTLIVIYAEGQWLWDIRNNITSERMFSGLAATEEMARWAGNAMLERLSRA